MEGSKDLLIRIVTGVVSRRIPERIFWTWNESLVGGGAEVGGRGCVGVGVAVGNLLLISKGQHCLELRYLRLEMGAWASWTGI